MHLSVNIKQLEHAEGLPLPAYMTEGASGIDLLAANHEPMPIEPGRSALIPTGLVFEIPSGHEAQIRPRSGLALKHGITILNAPGTIDADYRGEVKVIVINLGQERYTVQRGERIAQMVFAPVIKAELKLVVETEGTERGSGGFGHTGK